MKGGFIDASEVGLLEDPADYVIVGSGAGGGAAARVLAASGARVVVLEEGPLVPVEKRGFLLGESMATLFRAQGKQAAFGRATTPILQGRCVGGTTFVNSAIVWRIPEKVLAGWRARFGLGDSFDPAALDDAAAVIEAEMSARPVVESDTASGQDLRLRDGARAAGIEGRFLHRYEHGCRGSGRCLHGCPHQAKQSTADNYLRRAADDGATVYAHAGVRRVVIANGRAVAVTGRIGGRGPEAGRRFRVTAKKAVIVAASAVQSPNLLRRSGLAHAALGERFMAHPGTTIMGVYPSRLDMWSGASQGFEALGLRDSLGIKIETVNAPPEVVAARFPGAGKRLAGFVEKLRHASAWAIAVKAEAEGRVRPSLVLGDRVTYNLTRRDLERLRAGLKRVGEMHFLAGATEIITGVHGLPEVMTSPDELALFDDAPLDARAYSMVMTHLFGGCCAGSDPASSVVDAHLKVHGVAGLYVMDASVMPTNTGVNPQHGIMCVATVASRRLAAA